MPDGGEPAASAAAIPFDVAGARAAGYSDGEIANYVGGLTNFNTGAARKAGYADDEIINHLAVQPAAPAPPAPETSASGAFVRSAGEQVLPTAGGMAAAGMGAATGAALGAAIPGIGETGIPEVIGGLGGGLVGFWGGAKAVEAVQQGIINRLPTSVQQAIGQDPETRKADEAQHPYATMAGGLAPSLLFLRPGAVEQAAENAPAIAKVMANPIAARVFGAGVNTSLEAVQEGQQGDGYDPVKLGISAASGALLNRETALGKTVSQAGPAAAGRLFARPNVQPRPTVDDVVNAPDLDTAINAANQVAGTTDETGTGTNAGTTPGVPVDIADETDQLATGDSADLQQAALLKLFDNTGAGTVEQTPDGGYQFRTTDAAGTEITHPIEVWHPDAEPDASAIPLDTVHALQDHYGQAGVDVVFYKDPNGVIFDGAVDPNQPNTIFLSNNPERNIAQVAGHEFTHVLQTTTLPDGTSLGDLLNQQIATHITPAGQRHAQKMFGSTAPGRAAFPDDASHAAAVQAHLVNELGVDIGGEAPKFQTFLPRVVDAIQARFGDGVAKDVLTRLLDGLESAMETIRGLFGDSGTRSQHWVTNIGELHDTVAQMYAARLGTPVEREQAALAGMRDRAERDRVVAEPAGTSEAAPSAMSADLSAAAPAAASWPETRDAVAAKSLQLRRWLDQLAAERDAQAAASPQARLLTQTEAAIVRPVGGDETKLPDAAKARLEQVRTQIDEVTHPQADTPEMATVRNELGATAEGLAAADEQAAQVTEQPVPPLPDDLARRESTHFADGWKMRANGWTRDRPSDFAVQTGQSQNWRRGWDAADKAALATEPPPPAAAAATAPGELVQHTTKKGKVLTGTVRTDLDQAGAKALDPFTFKKDGGWFIRQGKDKGAAAAPVALAAGEHPGLVVTSLQTGKTTHIQPPGTVPPRDRTAIGKNHIGQTLYEDERGARSHVENGVRSTEPVGIRPGTRKITVDRTNRPEYQVAEWHPTIQGREPEYKPPTGHPSSHDWSQAIARVLRTEGQAEATAVFNDMVRIHDLNPAQVENLLIYTRAATGEPGWMPTAAATEHPGLIVTSLETGKTTHVQPPGTVPPAAPAGKWWDDMATEARQRLIDRARDRGVDPAAAGWSWSQMSGDTQRQLRIAAQEVVGIRKPTSATPTEPSGTTPATADALHAKIISQLRADPALQKILAGDQERGSDQGALETVRKAYRAALGKMLADLAQTDMPALTRFAAAADELRDRAIGTDTVREAREPPKPERPADYGANNKMFTAEAADKAREVLRAKFARLNAGFDPEMMSAGFQLAGFHIEAGARRFADYARAMTEDLGDGVRPYLAHFYNSVRDFPGFEPAGMDDAAAVKRLHEAAREPDKAPEAAPPSQSLVPAPPAQPEPVPVSPHARAAERDHALAESIARRLEQPMAEGIIPLSARELQSLAESHYGGTLASGAFSRDRLYDALELGVNRYIQRHPERFNPAVDAAGAVRAARELAALKESLPTQTVRAGEKDAYQQFSTPPDYAYAASWVANLRPDDHVLEPSAGVGGLIVHAMNAGVRETTVNELSDKRRGMIAALNPTRVAGEDAAQLHNILPADVRPTVVVMNPPFSRAAERMGGKMVLDEGAKHIEQALARLEPGGRLVAIVGDGMKPEGTEKIGTGRGGTGKAFREWWEKIGAQYDVRANVGVDRDIYTKYGTSFPTRFLVIDKNPPSGRPMLTGQVHDAAGLIERLQGVRDERSAVEPVGDQSGRPEVAARGEGVAGLGVELHSPTGGVGIGEGGRGDTPADITEPAGTAQPGIRNPRPTGSGVAGGGGGEPMVPVQSQSGRGRAGGKSRVRTGAGDDASGGRTDSGGDGIRPDGSGERDQPGLTPPPEAVLATENAVASPDTAPVNEAVYEAYTPQRVQITGAQKHPGALVQSAAMATVMPPATDYRPRIPAALVKSGALSDAQLEAIVYAGHAHSDVMANGKRRGFMIGDGTGTGKGREIAGIILDNMQNGRTKAIWISEKRDLVDDARRDWNGMGRPATDVIDHGKLKPGDVIKADKGILFSSYDTLKSAEKTNTKDGKVRGKERVDQIIEWVGKDFDGVIAFDEAHAMGNSTDQKGGRGIKKAAQKALAGIRLQEELPNARVVYVSATGATEVSNLAYAHRLGLWGEGTAFPTREDFIGQVSSGGIAGMELVARDMKALGHYIARNLSYDGVDYDRVEHVLTADQRHIYDKMAEGWQLVLQHFNAALEATGVTEDGKTKDGKTKSNVMSAFWGAHQRFFNQIITSMQMPSVIRGVEADLKAGRQAVLQLVNTMEAAQKRGLEKARAAGSDLEDLDMTPRDQLMQMVEKSYPVQQMEDYVDDNGNERTRPAVDSAGNPVINKAAVAARDRLLNELGSLRVPDGPLEMLLHHFGPDKVAEVTGRKQRVVRKPDDSGEMKTQVELRGAGANVADASSFQGGKKPILVFSEAGGTGRSYHAENGSGSENARRSHYLVQGGWRADKAVQGFGRTHRTNQASAPIFHLVTTDLQGQKRFISSIARRLSQLGALTKGERRAADQGMFGMRDNLESTEARDGLSQFFKDAAAGQIEGVTMDDLEKGMGLKMRDENGAAAKELPEMAQFLNRVLSLTVDRQNHVFQAFSDRMDQAIARASAAGTLDTGVETYQADKISKLSEQTVYTDPRSGAETKHVHLNAQNRNEPISFAETLAGRNKTNGAIPDTFVQNNRSGRVFAVTPGGNYTDADGRIIPQARLTSPIDYQLVDREKVDRDNWKRLSVEQARPLWDQQVAATPEFRNSALHIITGAVLPIWDRLGGNPKIFRLQTDEGQRMLGRVIPATQVDATLRSLGAEGIKVTAGPAEVAQRVLNGATARLANDWTIKRSLVAGEPRLELVGPDYRYGDELARNGVFSERIAYTTRFFIPTEPAAAAAAIEGITKTRPVTALEGGAQFSPRVQFSPRQREEDRTPLFSALTRAVEGIKQQKATPGQWIATLKNMAGVKPEERAWTGLDDWLGKQPRSVTKAEVLDYLRAHQLDMREVVKGATDDSALRALEPEIRALGIDKPLAEIDVQDVGDAGGSSSLKNRWWQAKGEYDAALRKRGPDATKFGQYTLPGGKDYREMLMTLPPKEIRPEIGAPEPFNGDGEANWQGSHRVSGVMEYEVKVPGGADGWITYWPKTYNWRGDEGPPKWVVWTRDIQNAQMDSLDAARNAIVQGYERSHGGAPRSDVYRSAHWDEPNVVAHTRFAERTAPDGKRVLHVEEIQSDWHQAGRREGYKGDEPTDDQVRRFFDLRPGADPAEYRQEMMESRDRSSVPDAPFKTTWPMLVMKRMTQYAVDHGFDRVAWTPGDVQADRYSLAKHIASVAYGVDGRMKGTLQAMDHGGHMVANPILENDAQLADHIGKETADRLLTQPSKTMENNGTKWHVLSGLDLKTGGEGMRGFYDRQLPSEVQKLVGKFGAKVGQSEIGVIGESHRGGWTVETPGGEQHFNTERDAREWRDGAAPGFGVMAGDLKITRAQAETQQVHSFDITPRMREAIQAEGLPLFSPRQRVAVRDERETERWTPEQALAYSHVGRSVTVPTFRERLASMTNDLGRRMVRYALDPYIGVKADDPAGYMALRNANTTAGATEMFLTDGTLRFNGSTYAMADRNGGVEHSLVRPLHGEQDRFLWWVAANRAERLTAEDRENLWSQDDIDTLKATNQGQVPFDYQLPNGQVTRNREAIYLDSLRKLEGFNKNVLDLAVQSGLLDGDKVSALFSNPFYVPFYRIAEDDGHFAGPSITSGFVKQNAFKTLKGGTQKLNNDLWDNAIKNWSHMIDASLRNRAASGVLDTAVTNGAVTELSARDLLTQTKAEKKNTVWVMNNGKKQLFEVHDPLLFTAISALDFTGFRNPVMDIMTKFKTMLTQGVTADPRFMLRVSIRDAEQAIATAPMSYNAVKNVYTGFSMGDLPGAMTNVARAVAGQQLRRLNIGQEAADAIAGGATMRLGSGHDTGGRTTDLDTMLDSPDGIKKFWHRISQIGRAYKEVTAQAEDTQRFALYHKLIAEGVPHDQAAYAARDLEDFTLKGAGPIVRFLTQTVPFMNPWMQGLYKVGRAAADQDRNFAIPVGKRLAASATKRLGIVLATSALATLALDALYADDEDYKKRPEYDRNANFWFKFGGVQFRIPMGFEIAAISRIAANGVEAFFGQNEMTGRRFINNVGSIFMANMSMNPTPQIARPLLDVYSNTSGTGAPIVGLGMDRLRPEEQYTGASTVFSRWASSAGNAAARAVAGPQGKFLAPIQLDYLVNGYFGWLGSHVVNLADIAMRGADQAQAALRGVQPIEPVRPNTDLWNFATGGMISTGTTPQSRYVDMLYQQAEGISRAYATYQDLIARGRVGDARDFYAANKDQIAKHQLIDKVEQVETTANRQVKRIGESPTLSAEQKRLEIMKYNAMRNRAAENVFGARP